MKNLGNVDTRRKLDQSIKLTSTNAEGEQLISATYEPFVDADTVAAFISQPRKTVIRRAREGKLTCYRVSGRRRFTYKFRLSEVARDMEKLRRPSSTPPNDNPPIKDSTRKQ
jgi:hypothetical protein